MKNPQSSTNAAPAYTVKSLVKALNILQLLADEEPPYTLTQLSRRLHLHVSTVHRLLVNLVRQGFVEEDPFSGGYTKLSSSADGPARYGSAGLQARGAPPAE